MRKNTSVSLGNYFDNFVEDKVAQRHFRNASEGIRAGLRLLEEEEDPYIHVGFQRRNMVDKLTIIYD